MVLQEQFRSVSDRDENPITKVLPNKVFHHNAFDSGDGLMNRNLQLNRKQGGMTLMSFLVVLAVVGFAAYIGMKLFPMYQEYYSVRSAAKGLASEPGVGDMEPSKTQDLFFRRLYINYSENVKPANVKIERIDSGWNMKVNYEVRRPLVGNLDVVGVFDVSQDLTRQGGTD